MWLLSTYALRNGKSILPGDRQEFPYGMLQVNLVEIIQPFRESLVVIQDGVNHTSPATPRDARIGFRRDRDTKHPLKDLKHSFMFGSILGPPSFGVPKPFPVVSGLIFLARPSTQRPFIDTYTVRERGSINFGNISPPGEENG